MQIADNSTNFWWWDADLSNSAKTSLKSHVWNSSAAILPPNACDNGASLGFAMSNLFSASALKRFMTSLSSEANGRGSLTTDRRT